MYKNLLDSIIRDARRKRLIRRALSLLCVVVLLFTMHTLRRDANTLERVPMCGYGLEHIHTAECYDAGALVCGMVEHVHTDACFQESPVTLLEADGLNIETGELELESDLPFYGGEIVDPDAVFSFNENDFELVMDNGGSGQLVSNDVEAPLLDYTLGEETTLSRIIEALGLDFGLEDVLDVGIVEDGSTQRDLIGLEKIGDDYRIWARNRFEMLQLAVIREGDVVVVRLLDGVAAPVEEPLPSEDVAPAGEVEPLEEAAPAVEASPVEDIAPVVEAAPAEDIVASGDNAPIEDISPVEDETPAEGIAPVKEPQTEDGEETSGDVVPVEVEQPVLTEQSEADAESVEEDASIEAEPVGEATDSDVEKQTEQQPAEADMDIAGSLMEELTEGQVEEAGEAPLGTEGDSEEIAGPTAEELTTEGQFEEQAVEASEMAKGQPAGEDVEVIEVVKDEPTDEQAEEIGETPVETEETAEETEEQLEGAPEEKAEEVSEESTEEPSEKTEEAPVETKGTAEETEEPTVEQPEETEEASEEAEEKAEVASEQTEEPTEEQSEDAHGEENVIFTVRGFGYVLR